MPVSHSAPESSGAATAGSRPHLPRPWGFVLRPSVTGRWLFAIGTFLLVCLFFAEENWRGRRAWEICQRELKAKGVELDWQKFVPPTVPDDQNFALTPFLAPLFDFNPKPRAPGQTAWRDMEAHDRAANFAAILLPMDPKGQIPPARFDGTVTDLEGPSLLLRNQTNRSSASLPAMVTRADVATAVLGALEEYKPVLEELRLASQRLYSRFAVDYDAEDPISILLPHYLVLQRVCRVLEIRASAELALQMPDAAFEDVRLMAYLVGSTRMEPFLMGVMSRGAMLKRTEQIIWEGLAGRNWTEAQLGEIETELKKNMELEELERGLQAERAAFGEKAFRYIRAHKNVLRDWIASMDEARPLTYLLAGPSGWFYQEQTSYHRLYDKRVLAGLEASAGRLHPRVIDENRKALDNEFQHSSFWHHVGFARIMVGEVTKTMRRGAISQNHVDQTRIGCALERYRLANGKYPENLESLAPQFIDRLPLDVCSGKPLKYRLIQKGRFVLYGVGWNEVDDGGVVVMKRDATNSDPHRGDWVFPQYPEK